MTVREGLKRLFEAEWSGKEAFWVAGLWTLERGEGDPALLFRAGLVAGKGLAWTWPSSFLPFEPGKREVLERAAREGREDRGRLLAYRGQGELMRLLWEVEPSRFEEASRFLARLRPEVLAALGFLWRRFRGMGVPKGEFASWLLLNKGVFANPTPGSRLVFGDAGGPPDVPPPPF